MAKETMIICSQKEDGFVDEKKKILKEKKKKKKNIMTIVIRILASVKLVVLGYFCFYFYFAKVQRMWDYNARIFFFR